jgi:hypothetical protein
MLTAKQSFFYLPKSPTATKGFIFRKPWFTEREEIIMTNVRPKSYRAPPVVVRIRDTILVFNEYSARDIESSTANLLL